MNRNFLNGILIACISLAGLASQAQEKTGNEMFSLDEALQLASENNREIQKALADVNAAKGANQQANAAFLPSVELSSGYMTSNDPLYAFGFKLQQQGVTMADFDPAVINAPGQTNHFATQVMVEQPLINVDAWMGKGAAGKQVKAMEHQTEYTREYVNFLVKQTYYALQLAQNRVEVMKKAQATTNSYLKMAEDNLQQGYLKEADVMAIKVRQYEQVAMVQEAENQVKSVSETLNFLMGRAIHLPVQVTDSITQVSFSFNNATSIFNRSDVVAMQYGLEAQKKMEKSDLMKFAPRINAFGSYNLYDADFGGFGADSYMVGIKLQWRIFNGGRNIGKYNQTKANYQKAQVSYQDYVEKENMELSKATRAIAVAESQLATYNLAAEQANESLRIRTNRYNQGMESTSDLLMAETKAEESVLKKLYAIYNYNVAVFKYQMLASETTQQ
ncbi:TolC family protein [Carboxylicivirga mesophila]|uniref:TolC family protein n=1 Tax=Carboxylicivirga mesophila TaxID=1166478 RepID=A0ABS5KB33_9BACT|nr:TolC family protein [Carboxylicivirga mesophila]MBS2212082.1 TolC family protein [Carboxylicivirga mesophila]